MTGKLANGTLTNLTQTIDAVSLSEVVDIGTSTGKASLLLFSRVLLIVNLN